MSLPLLALRASEVSAPFPENRITIVLNFDPRRYGGLSFNGHSVLMRVSPSMSSMPSTTRLVAERLAEWVSAGLVDKAGAGSPLPDGERSWSVTWKDFSSSVALTTCRNVNSPGGVESVPYTLVDFRQTLLDSNGKQMTKFEFALESEPKLLEWSQHQGPRALHRGARGRARGKEEGERPNWQRHWKR
jgi:hypothetical protein